MKQWFENHQRLLLWLANSFIGKWVFRFEKMGHHLIPEIPIAQITPNSIAQIIGYEKGKIIVQEQFLTRPEYAYKIYPVLLLCHFWDWLILDRWMPQWSFGLSSLTANPNTGTGGPAGDGEAYRNLVNQTLANIRSGAGTGNDNTSTSHQMSLQASATSNQFQGLHRSFFTFDTSSLTASAIISAATLSLFGVSQSNGLGSPDFHVAGFTGSAFNFVNGDYNNCSTTSFANIVYASFSTIAYNDFSLNASGISNISLTGVSKFSGQLSWDINNSFTGVWSNGAFSQLEWTAADNGSNKPKLVVTYTLATNFPPNKIVLQAVKRASIY